MNLLNPPELADGGYWYVTEVVPNVELGGQTPGVIPGAGWCAWYGVIGGVGYAAVRAPDAVSGVTTAPKKVAEILSVAGYSERPFGRVGGH